MWRKLAFVVLLVWMLVAGWSSSAHAQESTDSTTQELTTIAESFLKLHNESVVSGQIAKTEISTPFSQGSFEKSMQLALNRYNALSKHMIYYSAYEGEFKVDRLLVYGSRAVLTMTEYARFNITVDNDTNGSAPKSTEYHERYEFIFSYSGTRWVLADYSIIRKSGYEELSAGQTEVVEEMDVEALTTVVNKAAIVNYANTYWRNYNLNYRDFTDQDCTNFVSQALYASGWTQTGWPDNSKWWYNWSGQSHGWAGVPQFKNFALTSGRAFQGNWAAEMYPGDVIVADWENDGIWTHSMIVTQRDNYNNLYLTYHDNDTHNRPFHDIMTHNPNAVYIYIRIKTQY